jgi:hypothetical protein
MRSAAATLAVGMIAVLCAAVPMAGGRALDPAADMCFGAAARDPEHDPCAHPTPTRSVQPTPSDALLEPGAPCTPVEHADLVLVCAFGASSPGAAPVALAGDSHADHWRASLEVVAQAQGWPALSITIPHCPLTKVRRNLPEPVSSRCLKWSREVVEWFRGHPEVQTLFVSAFASKTSVVVPPGGDAFATEARGYRRLWRSLPHSIRHIVVLRDVPRMHHSTQACIERAMARHEFPGRVCSVRRRSKLRADPEVAAARSGPSDRVQVVDMTRFICGPHRCYPVVGGALVYKDGHHLTRDFAATLGPFVLRKLRRLMAGW